MKKVDAALKTGGTATLYNCQNTIAEIDASPGERFDMRALVNFTFGTESSIPETLQEVPTQSGVD